MKFIKLTYQEQKVLINTNKIIMVMKNSDGRTYLRLMDGHGIIVSESIEEVESIIGTLSKNK